MTFYLTHSKQLMSRILYLLQLMNQLLEEIKTSSLIYGLFIATDNLYVAIDSKSFKTADELNSPSVVTDESPVRKK